MAKKLTNLVIENIGLVDNGANQLADMVIAKRAPAVQYGDTITRGTVKVIRFVLKEKSNG